MSAGQRSISKAFHHTFSPGSTVIGVQLSLVHPGQGEALQSNMSAIAEGVGKKVTIRMLRSTKPMKETNALQMHIDRKGTLAEVGRMALECLVSFFMLPRSSGECYH